MQDKCQILINWLKFIYARKSDFVVCGQQRLNLLSVLLYDTHKSIQNFYLIVETEQTGLSPTLIRCLLSLPLGVLCLFNVFVQSFESLLALQSSIGKR